MTHLIPANGKDGRPKTTVCGVDCRWGKAKITPFLNDCSCEACREARRKEREATRCP